MLVENEPKKLKTFNLSCFRGKNYFGDDGSQNYLVFKPIMKYFKTFIKNNLTIISSWKSKGFSTEAIKHSAATDNSLAPLVVSTGISTALRLSGSCLKEQRGTFVSLNTVNIFIVYEIIKNNPINSYPTIGNCLFGVFSLTKYNDIDKYKYSGYGIGFDRKGKFSFGSGFGQNVISFLADMSSSAHADNKAKDNLILAEVPTQGLDYTTLSAGKKYSILLKVFQDFV